MRVLRLVDSAGDVPRVGLTVLAALTWLCMIGSASVLAGPRSPEQGAA
jgi:hypothetical protein